MRDLQIFATRAALRLAPIACGFVLLIAASLCGCASPIGALDSQSDLTARVRSEALALNVADSSKSPSHHQPALRWDAGSRDELARARASGDLELALHSLERAATAGESAARQEALRLPEAAISRVAPGASREQVLTTIADENQRALAAERESLARAESSAESKAQRDQSLARTIASIEKDIDPSVKETGRFTRALAHAAFAPANWIWLGWHVQHEYRGANDVDFEAVTVYAPPICAPNAEPLARFAPWIVQDSPTEIDYDPASDRLGAVRLGAGVRGAEPVEIDTAHPEVYAYTTSAAINGRDHQQLVYTWWYPEHPAGKRGDPEAGRIEGVTLRITLDLAGAPAIYETVYNCGCYHRIFVDAALDAAARQAFGEPLPGKRSAVEIKTRRKIDLVVPELFRAFSPEDGASLLDQSIGGVVASADGSLDSTSHSRAPAVHVYSRFHMIGAVRPVESEDCFAGEAARVQYELRPYEALELIPTADGFGSCFQSNGLVRGAERREGFLLSGLGMLSAGQPRQRGTQMIHFDQYDFDDPHLLETFLRLPPEF